jgi:HK97 family phage prohead protease
VKYNRYIITEKDFADFGIESHYDLDFAMLKSIREAQTSSSKSTTTVPSMGGTKRRQRNTTEAKGISSISGTNSKRIIKGFASTGHKDRALDVISNEALKEAVDDLVQPGANTVFLNHDTTIPIGRVLKTSIKDNGIFVEIMVSAAKDVDDIWTKIKEGILNSFSIRLRPKKVEVVENKETGQIEQFNILSMELFEVSVVGIPCNTHCAITNVIGKSFKHSIRKLNTQKTRSKTMSLRKNRSSNSRTTSAKGQGLSVQARKEVADLIKGSNTDLLASIKGLLDEKPAPAPAPVRKKKVAAKTVAKSTEVDPMLAVMTSMQKTMEDMHKSNRRNRRKALAEEEDAKNSGVPAKVLKNAMDPETVKFALYACSHADVHKSLSDDERRIVNAVYIQCADASTAGA